MAAVLSLVHCVLLFFTMGVQSLDCEDGSKNCVSALAWSSSRLQRREEGTHEQGEDGASWRLYHEMDGQRISPWHDIPLHADDARVGKGPDALFHFICEIPKGSRAKFEIHKSLAHNPIKQDVKKGKLRFYQYKPEEGSPSNYGALPQTWEDPEFKHPDTKEGGDNDPIDVLQINDKPCEVGQVYRVRALGVLALLDDDETDWKVIVVDAEDPATAHMKDIFDVPPSKVNELREWYRHYKTAEGKGLNKFGLDDQAMPRDYAQEVILETHESWKQLAVTGDRTCDFNSVPCWTK